MHSILKLAPVLSQKSEEMHLVRAFCSSTAKTFHDFNKDCASFQWHKSMFSFLAMLLNFTELAITGRIARVQFNSTLARKVKTRALKGIFSGTLGDKEYI